MFKNNWYIFLINYLKHKFKNKTYAIDNAFIREINFENIKYLFTEQFPRLGIGLVHWRLFPVDKVKNNQCGKSFVIYLPQSEGVIFPFRINNVLFDQKINKVNHLCKNNSFLHAYVSKFQLYFSLLLT